MKKDFQKWHYKKSRINDIEKRPFFHEREIWWYTLGVNVGFEQDGRGEVFLRPVVIFRKFNNEIFWAIPLTYAKKNTKYYFQFTFDGGDTPSAAVLSQIRLVDARRLSHKLGDLPDAKSDMLTKKFKALLP